MIGHSEQGEEYEIVMAKAFRYFRFLTSLRCVRNDIEACAILFILSIKDEINIGVQNKQDGMGLWMVRDAP